MDEKDGTNMCTIWKFTAMLALAMAACLGSADAGIDINEVGAFLVYPGVSSANDDGGMVETFLAITNTSNSPILAHVSFINGDESSTRYCYECDFDVPMSGLDTEVLVLTTVAGSTHIVNLDTGAARTCRQTIGFVTVDVEDTSHNVLTDNILLGSEVVVNYSAGAAFSVPAISIQGAVGDGNRTFKFDGQEYRKFPSVVGADFLAPDFEGGVSADLVLFTLAFDRQFPPLTDCSVIGFDANESQFSSSLQFGCWTVAQLVDIDPEFTFPFLGAAYDRQEHGWLQLSCTVYGTGANGVLNGGVHGAIVQGATEFAALRRNEIVPAVLSGPAAWSRILYQSGTVGDAMTLHLEDPARGGLGADPVGPGAP